VTDVLGRPVRDARIYVLPRAGEPVQTETNIDGRYTAKVSTIGTHGVVIAIGKAHTFRTVIVQRGATNTLDVELDLDTEGGEVIKIEDKKRPQPAVKPKPRQDPRQSLPYSDESVERDAWARAWLLLDVDEAGRVTRLKLLKKPGFDLDEIAIREAFKLRFDPARDAQGRPMKTYVLWTMEWPSWGWLVQGNGTALRKPADAEVQSHAQNIRTGVTGQDRVLNESTPIGGNWSRPLASAVAFPHALSRVPCAGSGPLNLDLNNRAYRDCSQADLSVAEALPWITPETAETAIAEIKRGDLQLEVVEGPPRSPVPKYVSAAVTGGLLVGWFLSYRKFESSTDRLQDKAALLTTDPSAYRELTAERSKWVKITIAMTGAVIVSTGVTLFLWNRNQSRRSFSVQPTGDGGGAAFSFGGTFD
jgi:hypothetical protein